MLSQFAHQITKVIAASYFQRARNYQWGLPENTNSNTEHNPISTSLGQEPYVVIVFVWLFLPHSWYRQDPSNWSLLVSRERTLSTWEVLATYVGTRRRFTVTLLWPLEGFYLLTHSNSGWYYSYALYTSYGSSFQQPKQKRRLAKTQKNI